MSLKKITNIMKIQNIELLGSKPDPNVKYFSDIDMQDFVKTKKSYDDILDIFRKIFKEINEIPNLYITDFKSGMYGSQPIRWDYKDIMKGYKVIDEYIKINFVDTLTQKSIIKLDVIAYLDDEFIEVTTNYYFNFVGKNKTYNEPSIKTENNKLLYSSDQKKPENYYKSLKLLYNYYKLNDDKKRMDDLTKIFNSKLGELYKYMNSLKTLSLLINNKKKPSKSMIIKSIKNIVDKIENMDQIKGMNELKKIDNYSLKKIDKKLNESIDYLNQYITENVDKLIDRLDIKYVLNPIK